MSVIASPYARRLSREKGLRLREIRGSGPGGRIVARDVEAALSGRVSRSAMADALPSPRLFYEEGSYEEVALSPMGLAMAKRMAASWREIPHFFTERDFRAAALDDFRRQINLGRREGERFGLNLLITRAVSLALMEERGVNVSFAGDSLLRHRHADIGMAVATDHGLIAPILWRSEERSLRGLSDAIGEIVEKARSRRLLPRDYEGGSFGLSNLGMHGVDRFTAVINPPQAAILAVGALRETGDGLRLSCVLSSDHRVIDGVLAGRFMGVLGGFIEEPWRMFV